MNQPPISTSSSTRFKTYQGPNLLQISMPMGGIGAGSICLNGIGGLQDFSIRNAPSISALPDDWNYTDAAFGVMRDCRTGTTKLLEGPMPVERIYDQGVQSQGFRRGGHEGLPRFSEATFESAYPFGTVRLRDPEFPVEVSVEGWSPFVPLDDVASGIPCCILNYQFSNPSPDAVSIEFSFHLAHPAQGVSGESGTRNSVIPGGGVKFSNVDDPTATTFGTAALILKHRDTSVKATWFRGGWFDGISALWTELSEGTFTENDGSASEKGVAGRNGGSVMVKIDLSPGESTTVPVILAWHFPNAEGVPSPTPWHPFYTTQWADAEEVARYSLCHLEQLELRTRAFRDALFGTTIPNTAIDAVASNLAILKSPTVLRQSSGNLWCWEGCFPTRGSCHGSCTHVWNYAQAIPHLYPALERTLREQELLRSMSEDGHVNFRSSLPDGPTTHDFHAAADGQLGGIMKVYREWQICGDLDWLRKMYPAAQRSLEYCIRTWDPNELGALFEPHHNTYDIEFWGPDGMCTTIYLGALSALAEMAASLEHSSDADRYTQLSNRSASYLDETLFDGDYYIHRVQWDGLADSSFRDLLAKSAPSEDDELTSLLRAEGPKYQYGTGCLSDGVIGAWMSDLYGIKTTLKATNVRAHLLAIYQNNFKASLANHACLQRPGYAIGHEPGLLLCTWPKGGKPTLPFVYSDEVWTGIEYQVASHLISHGFVEEGMTIVDAVRSRYDGRIRNPFCEVECGNYYARALSSFALLSSLSGFRYSAAEKSLWLDPKVVSSEFKTFFCTATGWGSLTLASSFQINLAEGYVELEKVVINGHEIPIQARAVAGEVLTIPLC